VLQLWAKSSSVEKRQMLAFVVGGCVRQKHFFSQRAETNQPFETNCRKSVYSGCKLSMRSQPLSSVVFLQEKLYWQLS